MSCWCLHSIWSWETLASVVARVVSNVSGPLWATSLVIGSIAVSALGAQLLCAASRSSGAGVCATLCAAAFARPERACAAVRDGGEDIAEINAAVLDSMYHPETSPEHMAGLVLLDARTTDGARYMQDTGAMLPLLRSVTPQAAGSLVRAFRRANTQTGSVHKIQRNFADQMLLDSVDIESYLGMPLGLGKTVPVIAMPMLHLPQPAPRSGVIALSRPGIDSTGSMAVMLVALRTPQSDAPDHLEKVSIVLLQRIGRLWRIWREWSVRARNAR